jgi:5-hydroxyisourate hydrolase-like protein (transthyretin family)
MKKFAILACLLMLLVGFCCVNVNATECVELSGTIIGAYENVWCDDQLEKIPLAGVTVTIEKIDNGKVSAKTTTVTGCGGSFSQSVKKGTLFSPETYRVSFKTTTKVIDGETYTFAGQSKTVSVKGMDVTVNFNPVGDISLAKNIIKSFLHLNIDFIREFIQTFFAKFA